MIQHRVTTHINRPVEQVFEFTANEKNLSKWQANFVEGEQLTEGSIRVGTLVREVRRMGPRRSEIQAEVTAFEENKRFGTKTLTTPNVAVSYEFESEEGTTRVTYTFTMITRGFMRLLEPIISGPIKKDAEADFERLKQILEK